MLVHITIKSVIPKGIRIMNQALPYLHAIPEHE